MARLPDPLDTLTPEAKRVYDKITAKRGAVRGPFASLMCHPALAECVGDLGEFLRFGGTLPGDVRELAILITARSAGALRAPGARRATRARLRVDSARPSGFRPARPGSHRPPGA